MAAAAASPSSLLWTSYPALRADPAGPGAVHEAQRDQHGGRGCDRRRRTRSRGAPHDRDQSRPALTPNAVKASCNSRRCRCRRAPTRSRLMARLVQGAGEINAGGRQPSSPPARYDHATGDWWSTSSVQSTMVGGPGHRPGASTRLGQSRLWGDTVFYNQAAFGAQAAWGSHVGLGRSRRLGQRVVWGDHVAVGQPRRVGHTWIGRTRRRTHRLG